MDATRVREVRNDATDGACVVYVMSRDQRVHDNHALLAAQAEARRLNLPVVVLFNLLQASGVRAREHFSFMLDGLEEVEQSLLAFGIPFVLTYGQPGQQLKKAFETLKPHTVFFDFSPLLGPRKLLAEVAAWFPRVFVVDAHNIVPVWEASDKQEFAARTFRPKIHRKLEAYLQEPARLKVQDRPALPMYGIDFANARKHITKISKRGLEFAFTPGEHAALEHLATFANVGLANYAKFRNDPTQPGQSELSPYLHFGQISSLRVALEVMKSVEERPFLLDVAKMPQAGDAPSAKDGMNALFEELIVRKELSDNFCFYTSDYTTLNGAPLWARQSLLAHASDARQFVYTQDQLEATQTHDMAWNAAQRQLTTTGKMHGYMRMYWAKKLLEWTTSAEEALRIAIYFNDAYSIDGGDPNGYVGILWSIAGLHDRPWVERPIFGKIRYMNEAGLRRKFDVDAYIKQWQLS